ERVAPRLRVRGVGDGTAQTLLAADELVLGEPAHRRVGPAQRVRLVEERRERGGVGLANRLERLPLEPGGRERLACVLDGWEGVRRPCGLGKPPDELDAVQSAREALSDKDGRTGAEHAADLP